MGPGLLADRVKPGFAKPRGRFNRQDFSAHRCGEVFLFLSCGLCSPCYNPNLYEKNDKEKE